MLDPNRLQKFTQAIQLQPVRIPPAQLRERILTLTREKQKRAIFRLQWGVGMALVVILWLVFNAVVQPGVALSWTAHVDQSSTFAVYRAEVGTNQFELVANLPSRVEQNNYTYLDTKYVPGKSYQYQVEAIGASGIILNSIKVVAGSDSLLPIYFLLLGLSTAASYALVVLGSALFWQNRLATAA